MKVRVDQLLDRAGLGKIVEIDVEMVIPEQVGDEVVFAAPVRVKVRVSPTGKGVLAQGQVSGIARQLCSRCLTDYDLSLECPLLIEYRLPEDDASFADDRKEDEDWYPVEGEFVDLLEPVRQCLLLSLPMKPLCEETCPGLAGGTEQLKETEETTDPRLQALAEWRKQQEKKEKGG